MEAPERVIPPGEIVPAFVIFPLKLVLVTVMQEIAPLLV